MEKNQQNGDEKKQETWLVFGGHSGWIGGLLVDNLRKQDNATVHVAKARLENRDAVAKELDEVKPDFVLNAAGLTGRPNVDWCEDHKDEVLRVNVIGTMSLADLCKARGIHMTNFGTGCIYSYDDAHKLGSGKGFTEKDPPNFKGSFYSMTKGHVQELLTYYDNVLTLRVRMPISDDLGPRNFITKISKYNKIVNIPNSMTALYELLPISLTMARRKLTGTYNFTNPGVISHNEIMDLYIKYIDPAFKYTNFSLEEQAKVIKAERSNNELDTTKFEAALPDIKITPMQEAIHGVFKRMKANLAAGKSMELP